MQSHPNQLEIMDKIKKIMISFKSDIGKRNYLSTVNPKFVITNKNGYDEISVNLAKYSANSKTITDEECFDLLENYLFKDSSNSSNLRVFLIGKVNFNQLTQILMKQESYEILQDKLIHSFFNTKDENIFESFIDKINKSIKEKGFDSTYGKSLVFKLLNQIGKAGVLPSYEMSHYSKQFPSILEKISKFEIVEEDYPSLHCVFQYYKEPIKNSYDAKNTFENFLKNKIPTRNWTEFKQYLKLDNSEHDKSKGMSGLFEEKINPKLHLNISEKIIKEKYPVLSISSDYYHMMVAIVKNMNSLKELLNIESCQSINTSNNLTTMYFLSKNEEPIDAEKIKFFIESSIELYADSKERKQTISEREFLTACKANILSFELEQNFPNQEIKVKKSHKL